MGPLHYNSESGNLQCDYCGSTYSVAEIEKIYQQQLAQAEAAAVAETAAATAEDGHNAASDGVHWNGEAEGLKLYNCPSCGAELVFEATTAATSCPYCGNPTVVPGQFHGLLRPDYILPFRFSKEQALTALKEYYRGKPLLPKKFTENSHLEEIKGVYVPFWLYDGKASGDISYTATRVNISRHGDEEITTTEYYDVRRAGTVRFARIPADGAQKMPDDLMDSIEPFDYGDLKTFSTAYLPGFMAEIYDVDPDKCYERIRSRALESTERMIESTVRGYSSVMPKNRQLQMKREKTSYALLPVWMLSTEWNGQRFLFAMNGQTGKLIGDLPISSGKYFAWFAGISLPLMALLSLIFGLWGG